MPEKEDESARNQARHVTPLPIEKPAEHVREREHRRNDRDEDRGRPGRGAPLQALTAHRDLAARMGSSRVGVGLRLMTDLVAEELAKLG